MTSPSAAEAHERTIRALSDRLVQAQRPIRILDAIKWDAGVEAAFFADGCRAEPRVDADWYAGHPLAFDPARKRSELGELAREVERRLGGSDPVGAILVRMCEEYATVVRMLEAYKLALASEIKVFQLQRRVTGVEVAVGAFFNGVRFVTPININFEHKKMFPGNLGPSTGEMGTFMFWTEPNRLFFQTLARMEAALARKARIACKVLEDHIRLGAEAVRGLMEKAERAEARAAKRAARPAARSRSARPQQSPAG